MGNMGFKDQVMAMNWTSQYIKYFGGDPKRVMIFGSIFLLIFFWIKMNMNLIQVNSAGNSAGAMSVSHLMVSPLAKGTIFGNFFFSIP